MRYSVDGTWVRAGGDGEVVLAGSPSRIYRLTSAGTRIARGVESGDDVEDSVLVDRLIDGGAIHPSPTVSGTVTRAEVSVVTPQLGGTVTHDGRVTIDDGSEPPLVGASERLEANRGPAAARNAGRRLVATDFVAFVDADVDLPSHADSEAEGRWWATMLGHFDDPRVGLVAPRVLGDRGASLDLGAEPARIRAGTRVSYVPAAMMIVRADAFDDVGGFDEQLRFGEDVDLVWRLDQAGWWCRYEPASTVMHRPRSSFRARLLQQVGYGSSSGPLALRHPRTLAPFRSNGWTVAVWALVVAGHPAAALTVGAGSSAALVPKLPSLPPMMSMRLAAIGHLRAGAQLATALRRAWWPIVLVGCLLSRRARAVAVAAVAASPATLALDVAFGVGVWRSAIEHRTWGPLVPEITSWPGRSA